MGKTRKKAGFHFHIPVIFFLVQKLGFRQGGERTESFNKKIVPLDHIHIKIAFCERLVSSL
ncbi:hypothetical protein ADS79_21075 [Brevibacillus reuszeri]|uniref:Uncharacterized protein n=1 Tax=Brevibacillus reuszeri TaxID=54915 RepID=A0A0K9YRG1_9BACL|nr:hypothetical protein ADS79_21075 [Brevibacillus reuszeri]